MKLMTPPLARIAASTLSTMNGMSAENISRLSGWPGASGSNSKITWLRPSRLPSRV